MGLPHRAARIAATTALFVALATACATAGADATTSSYPASAELDGKALVLNGAGTRHRAVFKVYDMAMYTVRKAGTPEEVLALPGPKRLDFTSLRELDTTDIGRAFVQGMRANASAEQTQRHLGSMTRLIEIFSSVSKLPAGERFAMHYLPGRGTQFIIAGQPQGAPVGDAEFFAMVLRIWLGPSPADPLLKDALLGQ